MPRPHYLRWIFLSLCLGVVCGAKVFIRPQDVVDIAHVMAGQIVYPEGNPIGDIYRKSLSFWFDDIPVFLMKRGVSDGSIHALYAGVQGGTVFAAITTSTFVFSSNPALALFMPLLTSEFSMVGQPIYGYPIQLPVIGSVPGSVGMALSLLVFGLYALGYSQLAIFLFGLELSIHPVMAAFCFLLWGGAQVISRRRLPLLLSTVLCLVPGVVMMAVSTLPRFFSTVASEMTDEQRELAKLFAKHWGPHWRPLPLGLLWDCVPFLLLLGAIVFDKRAKKEEPPFYFASAFLVGLLPAILFAILHGHLIPAEMVPNGLKAVMTNRWINYSSILLPVIVCAVLINAKGEKQNTFAAAVVVGLIGLVTYRHFVLESTLSTSLLSFFKSVLTLNFSNAKFVSPFSVFSLVACLYSLYHFIPKRAAPFWFDRTAFPSRWAVWGFVGLFALTANLVWVYYTSRPNYWVLPYGSENVFGAARKGEGVVLFGPQYVGSFFQGYLRRPLLHAYSDGYIYSPSKVDNFERLLQTVYQRSLRDPAGLEEIENFRKDDTMKKQWEGRSEQDWKRLSEMWQFTDVIVPHDWKLQLPKLAFGFGAFGALYHVPESDGDN